ncbi:hypothetical protein KQI30_09735 [Clostridium bornimense]|uniref:hypothetical protein n=1 Tax=Clostridium bornimense TaxID=1216932 RepID=UPI001C1047C3|nr:hypothetical protein [Clostridium bornimense]MBU5316549.1 hypothetical protein [Clostridium bornimense]
MSKALEKQIRYELTKQMFLDLYYDDKITEEQLKEKLLQEYIDAGYYYKSFDDITIEDMEEAVYQYYKSMGFNFENFDEIINYDIDSQPITEDTFKTYEKMIDRLEKENFVIYK